MMDFSRKNRKLIFWALIVLVGVPFVFITTDYVPFLDNMRGGFTGYGPVAQVGNMPIMPEEVRDQLNYRIQQMTMPDQPAPTYRDLYERGQVEQVLEDMIHARLIQQEAAAIDLPFTRPYLDEALKRDPSFQNERGEFDAAAWNEWVQESQARRINWDQVRESVSHSVRQRLLGQRITESVRVREEELREQFAKANTAVRLRYLTVEPRIVPTEEEIQRQYQENPTLYERPAERQAEFVAISVRPDRPAVLDDLAARARQGEPLADLARTSVDNASIQHIADTGWIAPNPARPERDPLFDLAVGDVSDVIRGPVGFHIYRVLEEHTTDEAGKEVRAEELALYPVLSAEERTRRQDQAEAMAAQAKEAGDLSSAAFSAGLQVLATGPFTPDSESIPGVPAEDTAVLARALARVEEGEVSNVIMGRENLYVARVTHVGEPVPQPLDQVREDVIEDVVARKEREPEHALQLQQLGRDIPQRARTLEEVVSLFPDVTSEIKEMGPVTAQTFDWSAGLFLNPQDFLGQLVDAGPAKMVGPIRDMMGNMVFAELAEAIPPDDSAWTERYPEERKQLQQMLLAQRAQERFEDYLGYLKSRNPVPVNQEALITALGLDEEAPAQEAPATTEAPIGTDIPLADFPVTDTPRVVTIPEEVTPIEVPALDAPTLPADVVPPSDTPPPAQ